MEIPPAVKRHLGLDDQPSWVIMREFNVFTWPGFDLAPIRSHVGVNQPPRFHYGHLPPALFRRLIETFVELRRRTPPDITPRDT
ncbi:hypothetical protein WG924_09565 [Tistrella sp. 25B02-3]